MSPNAHGTSIGTGGEALLYAGDPQECDFCGRPMFDECFFADAELPGRNGQWGILCTVCTTSHGIQAGWGRAQFYGRSEISSKWVCMAGAAAEKPTARSSLPCG